MKPMTGHAAEVGSQRSEIGNFSIDILPSSIFDDQACAFAPEIFCAAFQQGANQSLENSVTAITGN
jgi:hypothetical protein